MMPVISFWLLQSAKRPIILIDLHIDIMITIKTWHLICPYWQSKAGNGIGQDAIAVGLRIGAATGRFQRQIVGKWKERAGVRTQAKKRIGLKLRVG